MKKIKKAIVLTFITAAMALSLVACGEKKKCYLCGEVKSGKTKTVFGEEIFICNDCQDGIDSLADMFK